MKKLIPILALFATILTSAPAHALNLAVYGGHYFGTNENFDWAGEASFSFLPMIDIGAFYEHSGESPSLHGSGDESRSFYGLVGRFNAPIIPAFLDLRYGPHSIGFSDGSSYSGSTLQLGFGLNIGLTPGLALLPRARVQLMDTNSTYPNWNASLGLQLSIL